MDLSYSKEQIAFRQEVRGWLAVFLSGRGSSFVNGHTLYVDGGITTSL